MSRVGGAVRSRPEFIPIGESSCSEADLSAAKDIVFLIHGFNVSRDEGIVSLSRLADGLATSGRDALVGVLWPGDSYFGPLGYSFEGVDADDTASSFSAYIRETWDRLSKPTLSFTAHSKGCRVALETIKGLPRTFDGSIDQICLMAGAVDDTCLSNPAVYRQAATKAKRVTVMSSVNDKVLRFAYPAGDLLQAFIYADDIAGSALGYKGYRDGTFTHLDKTPLEIPIPDSRKQRHGDYLPPSDPSSTSPNENQNLTLEEMQRTLCIDNLPTT
ncbi:alpha/beta hydrolase [Nisaea nitritireducens]|uniref:alpha/beta hydrolase n=1 Tax=Nisaea nitritireducens TaxID=568392 RepID=UPI00186791E3|nr:alpha/beta hydrolase [Nisaea nitritireducens]